jgi:hypothetical protein
MRVILFLSAALCSAVNIVFVHIGDTIPEYSSIALHQASAFNPSANIYFLIKSPAFTNFAHKHQFPGNVSLVNLKECSASKTHMLFNAKRRREKWYSKSLRFLSIERFFHLLDFVQEKKLSDVFHLEYDNMLYVDLDQYLTDFRDLYPHVGATSDSQDRIIAGLIYFNNPSSLLFLAKHLHKKSSLHTFEMQILADIKNETGNDFIKNLPIIMKKYVDEGALKGNFGTNPAQYHAHLDRIPLIFDAAALGQYLGGTDPAVGESKPGFINETAVIDPSKLSFDWEEEEGLCVPYVSYKGVKVRIANLHIHSKNLDAFRSTN